MSGNYSEGWLNTSSLNEVDAWRKCVVPKQKTSRRYDVPGSIADLLEECNINRRLQFMLSNALKVQLVFRYDNEHGIIFKFGGQGQPHNTVNQLQSVLDAV